MSSFHPGISLPCELGGYQLLRLIGSGGTSSVFEALDAEGRRVAFKLLHPAVAADPAARTRLAREVSTLQRIRGEGIAHVLDAEQDGADVFIVTELVEGPTLTQDVRDSGPYSIAELGPLARQMAATLDEVHAAGLIHRDLKPGNVMIGESGPVLIDFGIAQGSDDDRLTSTGLVTGTPGYLDPEVVAGASPSAAGDWWAWAATLTFAATGRPPFGRGSTQAVLSRVELGRPDVAGLPRRLATVLRAALAPDSSTRASRDDVIAELRYLLNHPHECADVEADSPDGLAHGPLPVARPDLPADPIPPTQIQPRGPATGHPHPGAADAADASAAVYPSGVSQSDPTVRVSDHGGHTVRMPAVAPPAAGAPTERITLYDRLRRPPAQTTVTPASPLAHSGASAPSGEEYRLTSPASRGEDEASPWRDIDGELPTWARMPPPRPILTFIYSVACTAPALREPLITFLAIAGGLIVCYGFGQSGFNRRLARYKYGPRKGDIRRMVFGYPLALLRGVFVMLLPIVFGWGVLVAGNVFIPDILNANPWSRWALCWFASALMWAMPLAERARDGSRALIAVIAPSRQWRFIFALVGLGLVAMSLFLALTWSEPGPMREHWSFIFSLD